MPPQQAKQELFGLEAAPGATARGTLFFFFVVRFMKTRKGLVFIKMRQHAKEVTKAKHNPFKTLKAVTTT